MLCGPADPLLYHRESTRGKDSVTYDANTYMVRVQLADKGKPGHADYGHQFLRTRRRDPLDNSSAVVFNNSYAAEGR